MQSFYCRREPNRGVRDRSEIISVRGSTSPVDVELNSKIEEEITKYAIASEPA
jgi:hypothetical protein